MVLNGSEALEPLHESKFACTRPSTSQGTGESASNGDPSLTMNLYSKARLSFVMQHAKEVVRHHRVRIEDLQSLDLLHYSGMSAVKSFVEEQSKSWLSFPMRLLDVGAGIGGPARFLASHFDLAVITAVEYIPEQARVLSELNELCHLTDRINVVCADFPEIEFHAEKHGLLISQLSFLHMANKSLLFKKCNESLNESGSMFVEDFYALSPLTEDESRLLRNDVAVPEARLLSEAEYKSKVKAGKFEVTSWAEVTGEWSSFVWDRCEAFLRDSNELRYKVSEVFVGMSHFYAQMAKLFHQEIDAGRFPIIAGQVGEEWLQKPQRVGAVRLTAVKVGDV